MKSFITKVLIVAGLISLVPFFSYAASVKCTPSYSNDLVGRTVSVYAEVLSGNGEAYDYSWDGDDGIDATGQEISHSFSTEGTMTLNVTASSTDSSDLLTGSCSVNIYTDATLPDFTASCAPNTDSAVIGQNITWIPEVSGPLGDYSIVWTGTDGITEPEVSYISAGNKTATMVSFQSRYGNATPIHNAKLANVACTSAVNVVSEEIHNPSELVVTGSCAASAASEFVNDIATWNSNLNISGGASPYLISWTDSEGSMGTGTSVSKTYTTTGTKSAYLSVEDNAGQSVDVNCGSISINNRSGSGTNTGSGNGNGSGNGDNTNTNATSTATTTPGTTTTATTTATSTTQTSTSTPNGTDGDNNGNTGSENDLNGNGVDDSLEDTDSNGNGINDSLEDDDNNGTGSNASSTDSAYGLPGDFTFDENIEPGTYGDDITNLQTILTNLGLYDGLIGGFFGPLTEQALKDFQKAYGLPETGILDSVTRAVLNNLIASKNAENNDDSNKDVPSKISGLTASVLEAISSGVDYMKGKGIIVFALILLVLIGLPVYWFKFGKKDNQ